jgi:hypothetical protein
MQAVILIDRNPLHFDIFYVARLVFQEGIGISFACAPHNAVV